MGKNPKFGLTKNGRCAKEDGLKSKNARKQTHIKIQFYNINKVTSFKIFILTFSLSPTRHDAINFLKFRNISSKEPHRMRKYCHCNEISQCDPKVMMTLLMRLPLRFPPPLAPSFPLVQQHELPYCHHIDHFDILYNNRLSGVFVICQ